MNSIYILCQYEEREIETQLFSKLVLEYTVTANGIKNIGWSELL